MITKAKKNGQILLSLIMIINLSFSKHRPKDYVLTVKTKSVFMKESQGYLTSTVILTNNTADTLKYLSMTCSFQQFYTLKSATLKWGHFTCVKNVPITLVLPPHKSDSVELKFIFNDNNAQLITYKIGMELVKDEGNNSTNLLLHKQLKSVKIWSDLINWRK